MGGAAAASWRSGFVPLEDLTVLQPADAGLTDETKQAFVAGWYRLAITVPDSAPESGTIRFPEGTLGVPLIGARAAYQAMDQGDPPPCAASGTPSQAPDDPIPDLTTGQGADGSTGHRVPTACTALTVTGAKLGEVDLRTSRGVAKVPAWLFTVAGVKGTIARVAVAPSSIGTTPSPPSLDPLPADAGLIGADAMVSTDGTKVTFTLGVGACDYAIVPLFVEEADVVLVAGARRTSPGACIDLLKLQPVTITLAEPLGNRILLNGLSGSPLTTR
jgi:hypothetical protein